MPFNLFKKPRGTGALLDTRPPAEQAKDYKLVEFVSSFEPVQWIEKPQSTWRKFPIFNQNGSGSCVAQTMAKLLGILYWLKNQTYVHFSATHIYQRRANKPLSGMGGVDVFNVAQKGVTLEVLVPSQEMTDEQMDATKIEPYKDEVGTVFKVGNYLQPNVGDIDMIASVIQKTGKGVMVWFFFDIPEWTSQPTVKNPALNLFSPGVARHSVTAVDFTLYNGEKALIIEDSWGTSYGMAGQRVITESFFKARNFFAAYPMTFKFEEQVQKPSYMFTRDLKYSPTFNVDMDVIALQDILKYEGLFPSNVDSTGYYGAATAKAVLLFQKKYQIGNDLDLELLKGSVVGPKTRAKLNSLYS